jgi:hypothetical protein
MKPSLTPRNTVLYYVPYAIINHLQLNPDMAKNHEYFGPIQFGFCDTSIMMSTSMRHAFCFKGFHRQ